MRILSAAFLILALASSAHADLIWHDAYKNPFSSWSAYMYDHNVKRHLAKRVTSDAPATPSAPLSASDFRRTAKSKDVVAQLVAAANLAPADAQQLATQLRGTIAQLQGAGRRDNVATAMAVVLAMSFVVLERPGFDADRDADALVGTVNDALAASPPFRKLGAADRQLMYDSLLLAAAVIALVHQSGDHDASRAIATQVLQQLVGITPS